MAVQNSDSQILGNIPKDWSSSHLRWKAKIYSGGTPRREVEEYWEDGTIPWLSSGEVNQELVTYPSTYITLEAFKSSSAKWVPKEALIIALAGQGKTKGMVAQLGINTTTNQSLAAIVPIGVDSRYLYYWLKMNYKTLRGLAGDGLRDGLNLEMLGSFPIPIPPIGLQRSIVKCLDKKTTQIDTLIAKKQLQVDLLKEKRSSLITEAVTKGLNPDVKMKDSGVEWLGKIPIHWDDSRLKFLFDNLDYRRIPVSSSVRGELSGDYPYYGASGIIDYVDDYIFNETLLLVAEDGANLLSRSTPLAFIAEGKYWVNNHAHILRAKDSLYEYWEGALQSFDFTPLISGAAQPKLTAEKLGSIRLPLPPLAERKQIGDFITRTNRFIKEAENQISQSILLLKELRSSVISEAVTGKMQFGESS